MTAPTPTLAQIVAALSVTYTDAGVIQWLNGGRRDGPCMSSLIGLGRLAEVAQAVRSIGDSDPDSFTVTEVTS